MKFGMMMAAVVAALGLFGADAADFGFSPNAMGRENTAALQRAFDAGGVVNVTRPAMSDYGRTQIQVNGCRFYAGKDWQFISNPIANKVIDLKASGNMWYDPEFSAWISNRGKWTVAADLPGLRQ